MPRCIMYLGDLPLYSAPSAYVTQMKPIDRLQRKWSEVGLGISVNIGALEFDGKKERAQRDEIMKEMVELINGLPKPEPIAVQDEVDWTKNVLLLLWPGYCPVGQWLLDLSAGHRSLGSEELHFPDATDAEAERNKWSLLCFDRQQSSRLFGAIRAESPLWQAGFDHIGRMTMEDSVRAVFGPRVWEVSASELQCRSHSAVLGSLIRAEMLEAEAQAALVEIAELGMIPRCADAERPHIPAAVRDAVWHRDGGRCQECQSQSELEFDHIIPVSKGGSTGLNNLRVLCQSCNRSKGAKVS